MFQTLRNAFKVKDIRSKIFLHLFNAGSGKAGFPAANTWR